MDGEIDGSMYGATYPSIYGSENGARNNNPSGRIINSGGSIIVGPLVNPLGGNLRPLGNRKKYGKRAICIFLIFAIENGVSGAWEVVKKVRGGVALRCDRVSWRGEP